MQLKLLYTRLVSTSFPGVMFLLFVLLWALRLVVSFS